jgi:hypothetical protein
VPSALSGSERARCFALTEKKRGSALPSSLRTPNRHSQPKNARRSYLLFPKKHPNKSKKKYKKKNPPLSKPTLHFFFILFTSPHPIYIYTYTSKLFFFPQKHKETREEENKADETPSQLSPKGGGRGARPRGCVNRGYACVCAAALGGVRYIILHPYPPYPYYFAICFSFGFVFVVECVSLWKEEEKVYMCAPGVWFDLLGEEKKKKKKNFLSGETWGPGSFLGGHSGKTLFFFFFF